MVSLINFGGLKQVNGRTVSSGSQSGLDTASIIDQLATAKRLPAVKFEDNIKVNNNKISALGDLKSKLTALKDAVSKLRSPVGFNTSTSNVFEARTPFLSMSTGDTASNYVGVTTANGAPIGKYKIEVTKIATSQSDLSESFSSLSASVVVNDASGGPTTGKFNAGTFNINYTDANGAPQSSSVTLAAGSNLATVKDAINAKSTITGVAATIVKLSDTDYRLKMYSTETGTNHAFTFTNGTGTKVNFTSTAADDATIKLDDQTVTRHSNVIDDLIDKVTITAYQKTNGATVTLDIDKDNPGIATGLGNFMDAYNSLRTFVAQQSDRDDNGKLKDTSYLNNNSVMDSIVSKLATVLSGSKGAGLLSPDQLALFSSGGSLAAPTSLSDLGIYFSDQEAVSDGDNSTPAVENILNLDASKLNDYLQKYFAQTRALFDYNFISDNSQVNSYTRSNAVYENNIGSFSMSINHGAKTVSITNLKDPSGNALSPPTTTLTYDDSNGSVVLKGVDGTALEGMEFFFTGTAIGTTTANITVSQGVGDVMFNELDSFVGSVTGSLNIIDQEIENLKTQNTTAQASVDRIDDMVTTYRDQLLNRFSALEALVNASNQTLMLLDAQSNAQNNSN